MTDQAFNSDYASQRNRIMDNVREKSRRNKEALSFEELKEISKKRFQTVFVGAIDKIEQYFGELWGNDQVDEDKMTPAQLKFYNKFLELRTKIFDQGNDQVAKFVRDLSNYNIVRTPHRIEFVQKEQLNNGSDEQRHEDI